MSEAYDNKAKSGSRRAAQVARLKDERPAAKKTHKKSAKKTQRSVLSEAHGVLNRPWRGVLLGFVLLTVCVVFGMQSAQQSQEIRSLYSQLQQDALAKDALLAQQSRLLIERGALKSFNSVDRLAEEKLNMRFPETITRVNGASREGDN